MSRPSDIRPPVVAGRFYPDHPAACLAEARSYLDHARQTLAAPPDQHWIGGIVPHAGWICSAAVAAKTIATLAAQGPADVIVIFGAVHTPIETAQASLDSHPRWTLPTGECELSPELHEILSHAPGFTVDERFHKHEHSIEVELPLVQLAWPTARIMPIEVPLAGTAPQIGRETARRVRESGLSAVYLASTDLTHYGPNYRFTPAGIGPSALEWAMDNDRRLLRLIASLQAEAIVPEVSSRASACGGGAIAALVAACRELGATRAQILEHTNSCQTLAKVAPQPPDNAVGYAAVVIG